MVNRKLKWKIILIMTFAYVATNINLQGFMALLPFVAEDISLNRTQIGSYSTFFFTGATLLGILAGRYTDLFGAKKGMILGVSVVGILMLCHSLVVDYLLLLVLAFFSGIAFSLVAPSVNKGIMLWMPTEERSVSLGLTQTGVGIGGFLGAALLPVLGGKFGWRITVFFPGIFAIVLGLIIFKFIPDVDFDYDINYNDKQRLPFKIILSELIKNKRLINLFFIGFIFGGVNSFGVAHFTVFLHNDLGWSKAIAGFGLGMLQIGGLIAQPLWGWLNDRYFLSYRTVGLIIIGYAMAFFLFLFDFLVYRFTLPLIFFFTIIFFLGFSILGWLGFYLVSVSETVEKAKTGTAVALTLIFVRAGMVITPSLFGYLSDLFDSYHLSWILLSGIAFITTLIFYFREKDNYK